MRYTDVLYKRAYGGDMTGSGNSYYDRCYYYGWDPEWEDLDEFLSSKQNVRNLRKDIKTYADLIRNPSKEFDIDGKPVTQVVLSRKAYNEEDNISGSDWANQVDEALKNKDDNRLAYLSSYGYAWYGTKDADDNPLGSSYIPTGGQSDTPATLSGAMRDLPLSAKLKIWAVILGTGAIGAAGIIGGVYGANKLFAH